MPQNAFRSHGTGMLSGCQQIRVSPPRRQGKLNFVAGEGLLQHSCGRSRKSTSARHAWPTAYSNGKLTPDSNGTKQPARTPPTGQDAPVVVWYKHDLRVHDHPGLSKALSSNRPVVAFFCFDDLAWSDQTTELWGPQAVRGAVLSLKEQLRRLDVQLMVRRGDTATKLLEFTKQVGAAQVVCESEIEYRWLQLQETVQNGLPDTTEMKLWRAPLYEVSKYATNYEGFKNVRGRPLSPLPPVRPCEKPWSPEASGVTFTPVPTAKEWEEALTSVVADGFPASEEAPVTAADSTLAEEKGWVFEALDSIVQGGEAAYLQLLDSYMSREKAPSSSGLQPQSIDMLRVAEELDNIPGNQYGSFTYIFKPALALGLLSRRQVLDAASEYERTRTKGLELPQRLWSPSAKAAAKAVDCGDYHVSLGHLLKERPTQAGDAKRCFWRWHGQLVDFFVAEPEGGANADTPTILLVHGFGAFAEHWRRNIPALAAEGYKVYACTLPGFGPSEKSPQNYTTALWKAYVRDFVVHVIGKPSVVAGNSIGGVVPANACADHPHVFKGIVLINTAGSTDPLWDPKNVPEKQERSKLFVDVVSFATFKYLQGGIQKQLEKLYPTRPFNADEFLNKEIYRASCDPCAQQVLKSGFYLPPARPLPYMLNTLYKGPVLIVQGVLDPLNNSAARADALEAAIINSEKVCIDAGHCPHDEVPEKVNAAILEFSEKVYNPEKAETTEAQAAVTV